MSTKFIRHFFILTAFCSLTKLSLAQPSKAEQDKIMGIWITGSKKAKVEVYRCGSKYCGKIIWLRDARYEDGTAKRDKKNPDEKLKTRPLMGLNILDGFEYDGDFEWEDGEIYDPETGKTYSCEITMEEDNNDVLNVRGYVGISLLGRTDRWIRVKSD